MGGISGCIRPQTVTNALVRYWTRPFIKGKELPDSKPQGLTEEHQRTDAQGRVRFQLRAGQNMISLVQMVPSYRHERG